MKGHIFLPAFITILASYVAFHLYSATWIARNLALSAAGTRAIRVAFLLLAFFSPLCMSLRRHYTGPWLEWVYAAGYSWMGIILLAGSVFFLSDLLNFAAKRYLSPAGLQNLRLAAAGALALIIAYSFYGGLKTPAVKELRLEVPGLQPVLEGLKIAQVSDLHMDSPYKLGTLAKTVELINAQKPDLVFFTGDLLDPGLTDAEQARLAALTRRLSPRLGIFGVFGNHEYYFGYEKAVELYKACGITLLRNEAADAGGIRVIGLNDIATEKMTENELDAVLAKHPGKGYAFLLVHVPLAHEAIARAGKFLVFSGHVHGGQLFPFHIFTRLFYKYFYGLYRIEDSFFYVTSGTGSWGPPMRLLAPSEVPVITLERPRYERMRIMPGPI